jgi:outer membrane protein OmpA-like peptidoglycan-associated protein
VAGKKNMASDWDKTRPNIRIPRDEPEEDFGTTMLSGYRYQESEEQPRQSAPQQTPPPQQQKKNEGGGIPAWVWGLVVGFGGFLFLAIAGVLLYLIFGASSGFTLIVRGAPPNSRVFVDNTERGTTSNKGELEVRYLRADETHSVQVKSEGYLDFNTTVKGKNGDTKYLDVTPVPNGNRNGNGNTNNGKPPCPQPPCPTDSDCDPECLKNGVCDLECMLNKRGKINLTVNFETGKADILPVSFVPLDNVAAVLRKRTDWKIRVEGHTDNKGGVAYNLNLSKSRAASVMKYFADRGVDPSRMTSEGFGKSQPIAGTVQNQTEEQRAKNRRVTIVKTN